MDLFPQSAILALPPSLSRFRFFLLRVSSNGFGASLQQFQVPHVFAKSYKLQLCNHILPNRMMINTIQKNVSDLCLCLLHIIQRIQLYHDRIGSDLVFGDHGGNIGHERKCDRSNRHTHSSPKCKHAVLQCGVIRTTLNKHILVCKNLKISPRAAPNSFHGDRQPHEYFRVMTWSMNAYPNDHFLLHRCER